MIDKKCVCREIEKSRHWKMTQENVLTLAALMYIKEHIEEHESGEKEVEGREESHEAYFDRKMAEEWAAGMQNADGTQGPHFSMDKAKELMVQFGVDCNAVLFWVILNSVYSDDVLVARKHNVNTAEYYVDMAKAWINDKDAVKDKTAAYYTYIVQH